MIENYTHYEKVNNIGKKIFVSSLKKLISSKTFKINTRENKINEIFNIALKKDLIIYE